MSAVISSSLPYPLIPSVLLYAVFASYFAGVMVRLMLTLTPVVCILSAIALSVIMEKYLTKPPPQEVDHIQL